MDSKSKNFLNVFLLLLLLSNFFDCYLCLGVDVVSDNTEVVSIHIATNSENEGYEATKAFDGNRNSFWHSLFSQAPIDHSPISISCNYTYGCNHEHPQRKVSRQYSPDHPFELRIDLGHPYPITGLRYWPRSDGNRNGWISEYEVFALRTIDDKTSIIQFRENGDWNGNLGSPIVTGTFNGNEEDVKNGSSIIFPEPIVAHYLIFRAKSEVNGKPFASVAELEIISNNVKFCVSQGNCPDSHLASFSQVSQKISLHDAALIVAQAICGSNDGIESVTKKLIQMPYFIDLVCQYNRLIFELTRRDYYESIASQLPTNQAGILLTDKDPADVVFRRVRALWLGLKDENVEYSQVKSGDTGKIWEHFRVAFEKTPSCNLEQRFLLYLTLCMLRRELLFQRPELDFDRLLFVKRNRASYDHICDQFYGRSAVAGGGLYTLKNLFGKENKFACFCEKLVLILEGKETGKLYELLSNLYSPQDSNLLKNSKVINDCRLKGKHLDNGAFIAPELSFDGQQIAFAYCECEGSSKHIDTLDLTRGHTQESRCFHLFTCNVDGSDLNMISDGTWNDFDPCFLPNGRLAFISERRNGYLRCGRDCPNYTLFDMNIDGSKIRCLSRHETNEWAPSVANNGQIIWTRWDYVDRFGCIAHCPWTTSPDGRNPRAICGNYTPRHLRPDAILDVRAIPNSSKLIATASPHHGQSFGSIILIDPNAEDDPFSPYTRMTPEIGFPESQDGSQVWGTPWALAEDLFLAVADYTFDPNSDQDNKNQLGDYAIYLVDALGNRELIYKDFTIGSSTPIPLVPRTSPPCIPTLVQETEIVNEPFVKPMSFDGERPQGIVSIQNVYMADRPFPPGTKITAIRVVQVFCMSVPSGNPPYMTGIREVTSADSVKLARRVWGVAPVEKDGSACFYVPAECELYFQALNENGLVVQSMRSGTALRAKEHLACVGCHEGRNIVGGKNDTQWNDITQVSGSQIPLALRREPSQLISEGVGTQPLNFPELVQPILDKHCVDCHKEAGSREKGAPNLASEPYIDGFYSSYWNLISGGFACNDFVDPLRTIAGQYGASVSPLYKLLQNHHYGVTLTDEELRRIALWLDTNTMFYGVYEKEGCEKELRGEHAIPTLE